MPDDPTATTPVLAGVRVVTLESRRASELAQLLSRHGATVIGAPALREVALEENTAAVELLRRLEEHSLDAVILLTGVGTRALVDAVQPSARLVALLATVPLVARGPKPVAALRALGLTATVRVPEPNTWRELLDALDRELPVHGLRVAVQEYGKPNDALLEGLRVRGADVLRVPVYRWALPDDTAPLRAAIDRLVARQAEVVVFTTAIQLDHLLQVADAADVRAPLLAALRHDVVVAAIGPTAAEALAEAGICPDVVPEHPKLGYLVAAIAQRAPHLLAEKRSGRPDPA
jgi:uroporphyrinogen-III synthase